VLILFKTLKKTKRKVIIIATGSEVKVALEAAESLEEKGIGTRVVSMPSWELFEKQSEKYRRKVLPAGLIRIGVEAGVDTGWHKWLCGERGKSSKSYFVGMKGFGASGPVEKIFDHFKINSLEICNQVEKLI
jgi:transketolase